MQLCDIDDLYNKFRVIRSIDFGNTERYRHNVADGYSIADSELGWITVNNL